MGRARRIPNSAIVTDSFPEFILGWTCRHWRFASILLQDLKRIDFMRTLQGEGVLKDYVEAYKWFNLAASSGEWKPDRLVERIKTDLNSLESMMTPEQIAEAQQLTREFKPRKISGSDNSTSPSNPTASGTGFFITDDGYLISNYHVVKDATKVRLVTSAGLISAKVVQVDAANDLALLRADGRFAPLPIAASRTVNLGGTVATVGFPDIGLQGFAPKLAP